MPLTRSILRKVIHLGLPHIYFHIHRLKRLRWASVPDVTALTTNVYSNVALSNATASNLLAAGPISALGKSAETLYASIRQNAPSLSGGAPPTVANLQARMDATSRIKPDGIDS